MKSFVIRILKLYKKHVSPSLMTSCIFTPTCSEYSLEAYREHGFFKGTALTVYRLLRCNRLNKGGFDPVSINIKKAKWVL